MSEAQTAAYLRELNRDYAAALESGFAQLGVVYEALATLAEDPSGWFATAELLQIASEQGVSLALMNRFVDRRRLEWQSSGLLGPTLAYELGCTIAESLLVCGSATSPEEALGLPIVEMPRLNALFIDPIPTWLQSVRAETQQEETAQQSAPGAPASQTSPVQPPFGAPPAQRPDFRPPPPPR
jgi:hypothetical protein